MTFTIDKSTWTRVKFGDVVRNVNESVKDPASSGIDRTIGLEHIESGNFEVQGYGTLDEGVSFTRRVHPGQVLFGKRRAYLRKVAVASFDAVCSGDILVFEPKDERLDARFLPFLVSSDDFFDTALQTSAGSMSPRTSWKALAAYEFLLPPIEEQHRIADLLWRLCNFQSTAKRALDQVLRMRDAFWNRTLQTGLQTTMSKLVDRIEVGKSPRSVPKFPSDNQFGVLKVSAVSSGKYVPAESKTLVDKSSFMGSRTVKQGDLLTTRANADISRIGSPCVAHETSPNLMLSDKTWRIVPASEIDPLVIRANMTTEAYRQYLVESINGTEAKNLSQQNFLNAPAYLLGEDVRKLFYEATELFTALQTCLQNEIRETDLVLSSLSEEAFNVR